MIITKQSMLTGKTHTMDLNVTEEQMREWNSPNPRHIQNVFPNLNPDEREFLMTGVTPEEWDEAFGE